MKSAPFNMSNETSKIALSGSLTIYTAEEIRARLASALATGGGLELDLGALAECDTAGIQLLCSASATAAAAGVPFSVLNRPACVASACDAIGIDPEMLVSAPSSL